MMAKKKAKCCVKTKGGKTVACYRRKKDAQVLQRILAKDKARVVCGK